jgi:hypothetical protein
MNDDVDWEDAGRQLLKLRAERVGQNVDDALASLRMLHDPGLGVPRGTAAKLRVVIAQLEDLADAVEAVDADVVDPDDVDLGSPMSVSDPR